MHSPLITPRALALLLGGVGVLATSHLALIFSDVRREERVFRLFFLGFDDNVPAWYSSTLLLVAALLAFECARIAGRYSRWDRFVLLLLAALLLLMSCDEIARLHETLPVTLSRRLGLHGVNPFGGRAWLLLGGPAVIMILGGMFALVYHVFRTNPQSLRLIGSGFAVIVLSGVLLEAADALLPCRGLCKRIEILVEETLEMIGTLLICWSMVLWRDGTQVRRRSSDESARR